MWVSGVLSPQLAESAQCRPRASGVVISLLSDLDDGLRRLWGFHGAEIILGSLFGTLSLFLEAKAQPEIR